MAAPRDALDHWETVRRRHQAVLDFLSWLEGTHGLEFDWAHANPGTPISSSFLLDQFFEVDRQRLDDQRRALMDSIRDAK